ncbi:phosphohydrolase [Paraburkholderia sp. MMS20-SJTR3]|uniref:Phosphohydrolase n=1 Tax=Paraburkholderia sejongensis TaxID=2886946 RepID=A0ABS8JQP0_9BURK|nr:phosphohydrolase [Paraburkholderia sp. MMS20-SJTR3]MCC8392230.1 phosphohydrolase [Paraburkholderia sp. MMS20-SJTR3]
MQTASWHQLSEVAGVRIPRTPVATAAVESARATLPAVLLGHANRVFVLAMLRARRGGLSCDTDALYVSAMYANMGLSPAYSHSAARYELDSADAARHLLHHYGMNPQLQHDAWLAIALHTSPGIPARVTPLAELLAAAVRTDLTGAHLHLYTERERATLLAAFPRGSSYGREVIGALGRGLACRPHTAAGTQNADVLERLDPDYRRVNFCGQILGSPWPD